MDNGPVRVFDAQNSIEATLIVQLLADAGIRARVASDALESVSGEVPFQLVSVPVWVLRSDFDRAEAAIREVRAASRE